MDINEKVEKYLSEQSNKNNLYNVKKTKISGKSTIVMDIFPEGFEVIKSDLKEQGNYLFLNKKYSGPQYKWRIGLVKVPGNDIYKVFGVSGDAFFGKAPMYASKKDIGFVKEAQAVIDQIIKDYFK